MAGKKLSLSLSLSREMRNSRVSARVLPATFEKKKTLVQLPPQPSPLFLNGLKLKANPTALLWNFVEN